MAVFDPTRGKPALPHGGTFTANPVTMRAGLAAMRALTPESFAHLGHLGSLLREGITRSLDLHRLSGQCVGLGSLFKVHFTALPVTDYRSVYPGRPIEGNWTPSTKVSSIVVSCRRATAYSRSRLR
ncbi:glutamate-1-semialdehyde aminotransferase [Bradyrhizobium sp. GM7.3]